MWTVGAPFRFEGVSPLLGGTRHPGDLRPAVPPRGKGKLERFHDILTPELEGRARALAHFLPEL